MTLRNEPHDGYGDDQGAGPRVYVRFKTSSQPKGRDGYELAVSSEATRADVDHAIYLAIIGREQLESVLDGGLTAADLRERHEADAEAAILQRGETLGAAFGLEPVGA